MSNPHYADFGKAAIGSIGREVLMQEAIGNFTLKIAAEKTVEHIRALAIHAAIAFRGVCNRISQQDAAFDDCAGDIKGGIHHIVLFMQAGFDHHPDMVAQAPKCE